MSNIFHNGLGTDSEMFASSPLNVHQNTRVYYSKYDRDAVFDASGQAYQHTSNWTGRFEFNPEYEPEELERAMQWAARSAKDSRTPVFGVGVYPKWARTAERKHIDQLLDKYPGAHSRILEIPRGMQFDFHAPDHWTGQDSIYNSGQHTHWGI